MADVASSGGVVAGSEKTGSGKDPLSIGRGIGLLALSLALLAAGLAIYGAYAPSADLVHLQWAGSAAVADTIVRQAVGQYRVAIYYDLAVLIPGYTFGLITAGYLGWRVFWAHPMKVAAAVGAWAALAAGLCNAAQDGVLLIMLHHQPMRGVWPFRVAAALSFAKFALLLVATVIGLIALGTTANRLLRRHTGDDWKEKASAWAMEQGRPETEPAKLTFAPVIKKLHERPDWELVPEASWAKDKAGVLDSYWLHGSTFPCAPDQNQMGICLSGGGIRSATVALGALQVLQDQQLGRYLGQHAVKMLADCSGSGGVGGGI